ncbi:DUF505 domain-containing protein [Caldisericum exile]|uniref:DUF505 domain-containing protein n=1 Tax=Caldisericum exile (strain DSM 21853 / NBRC 104410 / AZM16c01) TaxID=511051 RepID=A0A7U6JGI3_CALEA|nr:DUF505 domain-containing protein [Caldisericum exile]BAL81530.1 hypothetical protein CSE_14040 [Caldisericum exile AZM16c01]
MVIKKEHAVILEKILLNENKDLFATYMSQLNSDTVRELDIMGLVRFETPIKLVLTYTGKALANVLRELYSLGPKSNYVEESYGSSSLFIIEKRGISKPEEWDPDFRFIGSEIIALLDAANKAGRVGPLGIEPLMERGLAVKVRDAETKKESYILSEQGKAILDIYTVSPKLIIDSDLANVIRGLPIGPARSSEIKLSVHNSHLLESMRLIAYSVLNGEIFAFTALGQAVKKTLMLGGFGEETVLSEDILRAIADWYDEKKITDIALETLQSLGYVGTDGNLLPAGEWALEVYRLLKDGPRKEVWSFDIEEGEMMALRAIKSLWEKAKTNPKDRPTLENLKKEMIGRRIKQYKELIERYGRKLNEMPKKYQQIAKAFEDAKDLSAWYEGYFDLRADLHSMESFDLIKSTVDEEGEEVFVITKWGESVLERNVESVSSDSVKAITITRKTFSSPNIEWVKKAEEEGLIGAKEPTKNGYFFANLAEHIERLPLLTKFERTVFSLIPEKGAIVDEVIEKLKDQFDEGRIRFALAKLEARHLIEILPDGNVIETEVGKLMDKALSGVPTGLGFPVNPLLIRVLRALREVGTLYVKERKVRILPKNIKEALKASGLSKEAFQNALELARAAGYIGETSINEQGLLLLEAVDKMSSKADLVSYHEILD